MIRCSQMFSMTLFLFFRRTCNVDWGSGCSSSSQERRHNDLRGRFATSGTLHTVTTQEPCKEQTDRCEIFPVSRSLNIKKTTTPVYSLVQCIVSRHFVLDFASAPEAASRLSGFKLWEIHQPFSLSVDKRHFLKFLHEFYHLTHIFRDVYHHYP